MAGTWYGSGAKSSAHARSTKPTPTRCGSALPHVCHHMPPAHSEYYPRALHAVARCLATCCSTTLTRPIDLRTVRTMLFLVATSAVTCKTLPLCRARALSLSLSLSLCASLLVLGVGVLFRVFFFCCCCFFSRSVTFTSPSVLVCASCVRFLQHAKIDAAVKAASDDVMGLARANGLDADMVKLLLMRVSSPVLTLALNRYNPAVQGAPHVACREDQTCTTVRRWSHTVWLNSTT